MPYQELLNELKGLSDESYRQFHKRLLKNDNINVLGVRVPLLRKIAKRYKEDIDGLMAYPDEYYEVTFIKLTAVSYLKYDKLIVYIDKCVSLMDNWATCDCFAPKCIEANKDCFLPYILKFAENSGEFYQRFALTALLRYYTDEEKYIKTIFDICNKSDTSLYYVHMAVAWLVAEMLVKHYLPAKNFILENTLDKKTHNKAIQKACESFRLSDERKNYLKGIKR